MKRMNFDGRRDARRIDAETRQMGRDSLTAEEQLRVLDRRLGEGTGAEKERARLRKQIEQCSQKKPKQDVEAPASVEAKAEGGAKKRGVKGKKQKKG